MRAEKLKSISLRGNNIGPNGVLALTKASWSKISTINLRNGILIKHTIKLETKDVLISQGWTGIWLKLIYVIIIKSDGNGIGEYGLRQIAQCYWHNLCEINLGNTIIIKNRIKLEI